MDQFAHLSVLISIILGLALAQLILGIGRIIQLRRHVKVFYWPALVWTGILLVVSIQTWWAIFALRGVENWSFSGFLIVLLHPLALFMVATLAVPDATEFIGVGSVDLKANYFSHSHWFFGAVLLTIAASLARPFAVSGGISVVDAGAQGFLFALAAGAMATKREWYHKLVAVIVPPTLVFYIGGLFAQL